MLPFGQAWVLLKENWYDQYPTEAMSMTNQQLEGRAERAITRLIDHPNWQTFKEAGYPWGRVEEFFGLEGKQLNDASSAFMDESMFREKEDDRPHIDDTDIDFAPEVFMEHERHNIVNHPDGGHSHEMLPTFGNVNINQPSMADGVGVGPDMQNIPLQDGEEDMFSPWNERYKGQRIGPHSRTPFSEQDQMKYASEPFDQAWLLLKAPYDVTTQDVRFSGSRSLEPFEGTLYSGGDISDTPKYYTPSLERALQYAVYGSATGDMPMRETSPAIRVVQDPGYNEEGLPAGRLIADPQLRDAYTQYDDSPLQSELMDDDTLRQLISQMSDKLPIHDTTGYYHSQQDRNKHIQGALERLKDKKGGRLDLTDSEKTIGGVSTGRHDELDAMDFDDITSGWDFLEDWEQRWMLDNRFDELPMWIQEAYS